jgi:hypothetical protein
LRRSPQWDLAFFVHLGDGHVRLDRHVLHVRDAVLPFHDRRTLRPRRFGIALADLEVIGHVRARLREDEVRHFVLAQIGMEQRRFRACAKLRIEHRLQHFVLHLDQLDGYRDLADGAHPPPDRRRSARGHARRYTDRTGTGP